MRSAQRQRLIEILSIQSYSKQTGRMRGYMKQALQEAGCSVQKIDRQLHVRKGNSDKPVPLFVAHSDTVHPIVPDEHYQLRMTTEKGDVQYFAFNPVKRELMGVGGDDKCGLWVVLEAAHALDNMAAIVTIDEEIGCVGAKLVKPEHTEHAAILIQADRRGKSDAVRKTYGGTINSKAWQEHVGGAVKAHGYNWCDWGASTDVAAIIKNKASSVGAVNLSAGYHRPHSAMEYVSEEDLENCLHLALQLATMSEGKAWDHAPEVTSYTSASTGSYYKAGYDWQSPSRYYNNNRGKLERRAGGKWEYKVGGYVYDDGTFCVSMAGRYYYWDASEVSHYMGDTEESQRSYIDGLRWTHEKYWGDASSFVRQPPLKAATFKPPTLKGEATCHIEGCRSKENLELHGKSLIWFCGEHADRVEILGVSVGWREALSVLAEEVKARNEEADASQPDIEIVDADGVPLLAIASTTVGVDGESAVV